MSAPKLVDERWTFPPVTLVPPSRSRYLHLAAQIDSRPPFLPSSAKKHGVLERCRVACERLRLQPGVLDARVFDAIFVPPGHSELLRERAGAIHDARYDLVVLVECGERAVGVVRAGATWCALEHGLRHNASSVHFMEATNVRRIGAVDHERSGVFLFHYFVADSVEQNLKIWNHTAGWFQAETGLDNSTVLLPLGRDKSKYSLVNHCRWDSLGAILPSLVFKRSFREYVLESFRASNIAAMPVLYRLA
jgi:hypothetical protein